MGNTGRLEFEYEMAMFCSGSCFDRGCLADGCCGLGQSAEAVLQNAPIDSRPNIVLISVDDLNNWVGYLKGHSQVKTPNMDRLASRGVAFTNAHCTTPLCQPSRTAVLTGLAATKTNVFGNGGKFDHTAYKMLPQFFADNGYSTYGTGKIHHKKSISRAIFQDSFTPEQRWSPFNSEDVNYSKRELKSKGSEDPQHVIANGPGGKRYVLPFNHMSSERAPKDPKVSRLTGRHLTYPTRHSETAR